MGARAAARLAWGAGALGLFLWAIYLAAWVLGGFVPMPVYAEQPGMDLTVRAAAVLTYTTILLIGALVASRHPRNPIGWLLCAAGIQAALSGSVEQYAALASIRPDLSMAALPWMLWATACLYAVGNAVFVPLLLLFPDGRLPGARWSPVLLAAAILGIVQLAVFAIRPGPFMAAPEFANPLGVPAAEETAAWLLNATVKGFLLLYLLAAGSILLRLRGARGVLRRQLQLVGSTSTLYVAALGATYIVPVEWFAALGVLHYLLIASVALSIGLAVLRYRLYEIDLVVNRALVYGALALTITAVYIVVVAGIGGLIGTQGGANLWLSLLATALVALAFEPLRERFQRLANRLVYGPRANPYDVLADFSRRMASTMSVDDVLPRVAEAAARGVGATHGRARVHLAGGRDRTVTWPEDLAPAAFDYSVAVMYQREPVGEIAVAKAPGDPLRPPEERLLADLAAQAGLAMKNVRLALELESKLKQLAAQAEELRASRQRIVAAQDSERRRLERDLHDGAQQQLVSIAVQLRMLKRLIDAEAPRAAGAVDELLVQTNDALSELRDLARGIFPSILADRGLVAGVRAHLAKSHPGARLELQPELAEARDGFELEAAVYFCIREALQNVAKHAAGAQTTVRLASDGEWLTFSVEDDGPGFDLAAGQDGTGLQGMADRLAAVDGWLEVCSMPGQGTTLRGRVPLRSKAGDQSARLPDTAAQAAASVSGPNSPLEIESAAPHSSAQVA
jgi:signal transduction histidine kinase